MSNKVDDRNIGILNLNSNMVISESFIKSMGKQLSEKADLLLGFKNFYKIGFHIQIDEESKVENQIIKEHLCMRIWLISPDAHGYSILVAWKCKESGKLINTSDEVDDSNIEFFWCNDFPKEEISKYLKPYKKIKSIKSGLNFDVEFFYGTWPDIVVTIFFAINISSENMEIIERCITDFIADWNTNQKNIKENHLIHDLTGIEYFEDHICTIYLDMGTCKPKSIQEIIKIINRELGFIKIEKVVIS